LIRRSFGCILANGKSELRYFPPGVQVAGRRAMARFGRTMLVARSISMHPLWLVLLLAAVGCGEPPDQATATDVAVEALTAQDVMGFESLAGWTPSSGTESLTSMHTQGVSAYALAVPVNFTNIVSASIDNTAPNLQGLANTGSSLALDMIIPTQQPNPSFLGSVQLLVSVPSRNVFNLFLAQVELTGLPLGTFQTLHFTVPDSLRTSLRGATFNDLSFTIALNAPSGATGTYIFDNLRVLAANNADFSLTPSPASVTVVAGATATSTIAVGRAGGFSAGVALAASGLPSGVTAAFSPATATGGSSTVTFTAASGAVVGTANVTITGTGGGLSRTASVSLTVAPAPNFTLSASPASVSVVQGATAQSTVSVTRQNGFASSVTFSASGLPSGVTASFTPASTAGGSSVVTFSAGAAAAVGIATVTITGAGGGLSRTTTISLTVAPAPNFTLAASPASLSVVQGATAQSTVSITRQNGFSSAVALSASGLPAGVTASFSPASTTGGSSVVTFSAATTAAIGTTTVTITGTGGGLARTTSIVLTVTPAPDFSLAVAPGSVTVVIESTATAAVTVTPLNGFAGSVTFGATGLPAGVTASFNPPADSGSTVVTFAASASAALGTTSVTLTGTAGGLVRTTVVALTLASPPGDFSLTASASGVALIQGDAVNVAIGIARVDDFPSTIILSASGLPSGVAATFTPTSTTGDSVTLTLSATELAVTGPATVTVTGQGGGLVRAVTLELTVSAAPTGDFSLSASPTGVAIAQGASGGVTIDIARTDGFADAVAFSAGGLPAGLTATFTPPSTTGDSVTLTLTAASGADTGAVTITVTGTGGGLTRTTTLALTVNPAATGDFDLAVNPNGFAIGQGDSASGQVLVTPQGGFGGTITFSASGLPAGVTATFSPPTSTGSAVQVTFTAAAGAATGPAGVVITGTSGSISHGVPVSLLINPATAGDFDLVATPSGFGLNAGDQISGLITVERFGLTAPVAFSVSGLPAGVTASFAPATTSEDQTVLTLTVAADAPSSFSTLTVSGAAQPGGSPAHTVELTLLVNGS
jgi:uncharacterized membrane protein